MTRPEAQCRALEAGISARGGTALVFPLIAIEAIDESDEIRTVREALGHYDIAFFVSPNAVDHGLAVLGGRAAWPRQLRVAGVGLGTRVALERHGFSQVITPEHGADSEAVLSLPEFSPAALAGRNLLILRGDGGRDLLGREAERRGARVRHLTCYRRRPPDGDAGVLLDAARQRRLSALVVTSSEALGNLAIMAGEGGSANSSDCRSSCPIRASRSAPPNMVSIRFSRPVPETQEYWPDWMPIFNTSVKIAG